jgi:predicted nucleic acid-binding protein
MSRVIFLDAGPLGLLTNPKKTPETIAAAQWAMSLMRAGHRLVVPAIADYEVRRELERAGKAKGIARLDAFNAASPDRYLPLTDSALRLAARLWAQARNSGTLPADPKELNCDVLIAAQVLDTGIPAADLTVATVNVGHLSLSVPADLWTNIHP